MYLFCKGGQYYYRFGSIHANIIGLEVVLPDGSILDLMSTNRKDNTGYDLKHLFVGAGESFVSSHLCPKSMHSIPSCLLCFSTILEYSCQRVRWGSSLELR